MPLDAITARGRCQTCGARLSVGSHLGSLCPRCLAALAVPCAPLDTPDSWFDAYRLVRPLGEGGMGVVWLAEQHEPIRRSVALKVVKPGTDSTEVLRRFESERQALAILNHPNIAMVFDAGVASDGRPYFVMEHVPGEPVTEFADRCTLTIDERIALFLQVCEAVQHAHQRGVLHRDLKPSNILVAEQDGHAAAKIIDFGVAKAIGPRVSDASVATQVGTLVGTPEYMSPEQATLTDALVDTRTDVYSLGLVLYELLVGSAPHDARDFGSKDLLEVLRVIREVDAPLLRARLSREPHDRALDIARRRNTTPAILRRELRGDLEWITARAIEKDPARRYQSASELAGDLRRHLADEVIAAGPPTLVYRLGKLARRHRALAAAAAIAVAAVGIGGLFALIASVQMARAQADLAAHVKALQVSTGLALASSDERLKSIPWLVAAMEMEDGGPRAEELHRIRLRQVMDRSPIPVRMWMHDGMLGAALASGGPLATWNGDGEVRIWHPQRQTLAGPVINVGEPFVDVSVSVDGALLVTAGESGRVRVWSTAGGHETIPPLHHGAGLRRVRISPDGSTLLSADAAGLIQVWSIAASQMGRLVASIRHDLGIKVVEFVAGGRLIAAAGETGPVIVAERDGGRILHRLEHESVSSVAGWGASQLITSTSRGILRAWDLTTGTSIGDPTPTLANTWSSMAVASDGSLALMCGTDGAALVRPRTTRAPVRLDPNRTCDAADLSATGMAAIGAADGSLRVFGSSGSPFTARLPHQAGFALVRFLADGRYVLTADRDGVVRMWDLAPAAPPSRIDNYSWTSSFSHDGRRLALASGSSAEPYTGAGHLMDPETFEMLAPPLRHGHNVRGIAYSPDGRLVATAAQDGTARLWEVASGEPASAELRHPHGLHAVGFSSDGTRIATFGIASDVQRVPAMLWDVPTSRLVAAVGGDGHVRPGGFSPDGRHLLTVTGGTRVQLWRSRDGAPIASVDWAPYTRAAFLSDSEIVLIGTRSQEVRRFDGSMVASRAIRIESPHELAVDPTRRLVTVSTGNGTLPVWRVTSGLEPPFPPLQLPGSGTAAAFSLDGRWLLGVSGLRRAQVWSMENGEPAGPQLPLPAPLPSSASFAPDNSRFQVGGEDAVIWDLRPVEQPVATLKKIAAFLSAHEIRGSQLVPLSAARLGELARDPQIAAAMAPASASRWQWLAASQYLRTQQWDRAEAETAAMVEDANARWEVWTARGNVLAELGRWQEADRAFSAALARRPDWTQLLYFRALARYGSGDRDAIRSACTSALTTHGSTKNPDRAHWLARLCVHGAGDGDAAAVADLARLASDIEPDIEAFGVVYAGALLRMGEHERALATLKQLAGVSRGPNPSPGLSATLILARAGRGTGSATTTVEGTTVAAPALPWYARIELDLWAEALAGRR